MSAAMHDLIAGWLDGDELAAAEPLTLALRAAPEARRQFVELAMLEVALHRLLSIPPIAPAPHRPRFRFPPGTIVILALIGGAAVVAGAIYKLKAKPSAITPMSLVSDDGSTSRIAAGETIRAPLGSFRTIRFNDGSVIQLQSGSAIRIEPATDGHGALVRLDSGSAIFHLKLGCRNFQVVTSVAEMQAMGPEFAVALRGNPPHMRIQAHTGARVSWDGNETDLKAGETGTFPR